MGWLRRRRGKHVAGRVVFLDPAGRPAAYEAVPAPPSPAPPRPVTAAPVVVAAPAAPVVVAAPAVLPAPLRPAPAPAVPAPAPETVERATAPAPRPVERDVPWPGPAVSLVFVDGSEFRLPAGDQTAQQLIALAGELSLGVTRRSA